MHLEEIKDMLIQAGYGPTMKISPFVNDPFVEIVSAYKKLWPTITLPTIQWLSSGELHKNEDSPWGYFEYNDDEAIIGIDTLMPVSGAIDVLAHELAHAACHYLELKECHGCDWKSCFNKLHKEYEKAIQVI